MIADWKTRPLNELVEFLNNKRVPLSTMQRQNRKGEYPYYGASGIVDYLDDYIFDGEYLLISEDGENLRTRKTPIAFKAKGKFWVNNHAHILAEKEEGILDYLEYYFSILNIGSYITGAVQPKLNKMNLGRVEILIPEKGERLQINEILNSLTNKITLNTQINQSLESMAQAIFKSWFVDFEPVKAKIAAIEAGEDAERVNRAAMRAISGKNDDELNKMQSEQPDEYAQLEGTAKLFPAAMWDSELGEVPQGWEVSIIGDEVKVVGGGTPSTKNSDFWEGGEIHWTTPKDLSNLTDKVLLTTERKITEAGLKKVSSGLLPVNTVLMSSRAPVGYLALAKVPMAVNQGYIAMICQQRLSPEYVIQWCNSVMTDIKQRSSGTTFAEISKKNFKIIPVLVSSEEVQQSYSKLVSGFYDKITENVSECITLADIRDSLIPKLLSGEVTVQGCALNE